MRLINTSTYELHEFFEKRVPLYAILSHRWEDGEVTFQDLRDGIGPEMMGWGKIVGCCAQAAQNGWKYAVSAYYPFKRINFAYATHSRKWVDSCCIDKTSSAEVSEAINSMFDWYRGAEVCYAYLADVPSASADHKAKASAFRQSRWFTRGWTLQELLAPQWVEFYDQNWEEIGTKSSLTDIITSITGITHLFSFEDACVAQVMSWASKRETTKVEDQAYCLMGLFNVHMPPLYGEGTKAFFRLQVEILSKTDDESIFAWFDGSGKKSGLLASSPERFRRSGNIGRCTFDAKRPPHAMTNQGLRLELLLLSATQEDQSTRTDYPLLSTPSPISPSQQILPQSLPQVPQDSLFRRSFLAPLNCMLAATDGEANEDKDQVIALPLFRESDVNETRAWFRRGQLQTFSQEKPSGLERAVIYTVPDTPTPIYGRPGTVLVRIPQAREFPFQVSQKYDSGKGTFWAQNCNEGQMLKSFYKDEELAALLFAENGLAKFALILGSSASLFWVDLVLDVRYRKLERVVEDFIRSKDSRGGGERISRVLAGGLLLSVSSKKEFQAGSYRYAVDVAVERGSQLMRGGLAELPSQ